MSSNRQLPHRFIAFAVVLCFLLTVEGSAQSEQLAEPPHRVAVIPFVNITGNTADDWIGVGIAETITTELERLTSQTVIRLNDDRLQSDSSLETLATAGQELNARWVVSGTYQRMGDPVTYTHLTLPTTPYV